jgi:hypothetical protein
MMIDPVRAIALIIIISAFMWYVKGELEREYYGTRKNTGETQTDMENKTETNEEK